MCLDSVRWSNLQAGLVKVVEFNVARMHLSARQPSIGRRGHGPRFARLPFVLAYPHADIGLWQLPSIESQPSSIVRSELQIVL